jgi:hypothetical protein
MINRTRLITLDYYYFFYNLFRIGVVAGDADNWITANYYLLKAASIKLHYDGMTTVVSTGGVGYSIYDNDNLYVLLLLSALILLLLRLGYCW